jgi:hypothetical protein
VRGGGGVGRQIGYVFCFLVCYQLITKIFDTVENNRVLEGWAG